MATGYVSCELGPAYFIINAADHKGFPRCSCLQRKGHPQNHQVFIAGVLAQDQRRATPDRSHDAVYVSRGVT